MKHLFVVNPAAGNRDKSDWVREQVSAIFAGTDANYEVYQTRAPMDAVGKIKAESSSCNGELRVYACGGDGTLNECVNGAAGLQSVAVTHIPCGTGNDFIKMFGEDSSKFSIPDNLIRGDVRDLDLIKVNGRYCINISSVGIDARIGHSVHKYSKLPIIGGSAGYLVSAGINMVKGISMGVNIQCDNFRYEGNITLVCACNGRFYGGAFNPVPDAQPDDGLIDFLIIRQMSRFEFFRYVGKYAKGGYREIPDYITHIRGRKMDIECGETTNVNIDGESIPAKRLSFNLIPRGVRFIFPRNMRFFKGRDMYNGVTESNS